MMETYDTAPQGPVPRLGRSLSLDQAARLLGVSRRTIYNRIRDGRLRTVRTPGGSQRVLVESCRAFVDELGDAPRAPGGKPIDP